MSFVICHLSFVIRHLSFVIRHSSFVIRHSSFLFAVFYFLYLLLCILSFPKHLYLLTFKFEMEASHKTNPQQWLSIVTDKFRMSSNGGPEYTAEDIVEAGTYNLFLGDTEHYRSSEESFDSSYQLFHSAFPNGFHWELIEVLSGPPNVVFKWRHWGTFSGSFKNHTATGETIEIIGISVAQVTEDLKIQSVEHYFDNSAFLQKLTAGCPVH
ncbi:ester cyclase [Coleofasciculus sp. F4-SAH-05]|uniref:ester cyclase n=1 Tax=Coleofasciculus sp. F4-SAH-05 TaxID=3069525 RepID=UPI00330033B5